MVCKEVGADHFVQASTKTPSHHKTRIPPFLSRGTSDCGPEQNTDTVGQGQAEGTTDHQAPARAHWGGTRDLG
ncbi:hypothetical protein KaCgl_15150 [Corynebacterium glutamicum]|nr:hypothetical protein KaCgl_15150 [Corynebacterium glutamicum]GGO22480.1 hypothetical protein GCM10010980_24620 [Corynebacterium marinum]